MTVTDLSPEASTVRLSMGHMFAEAGYTPHPGQIPVHRRKKDRRFRVISAGRRYGKSALGGNELVLEAYRAQQMQGSLEPKGKRHEYWIVGPEYSDSEKEFRVLYNAIKRIGFPMDRPGTYYSEDATSMRLSLFGGRFLVDAKSAKHPESLVGEGLQGVIMAEAAKLKSVVWTKSIRPTLADYANEGSWALFSTTPEGKNWLYDQWMRGQDPDDPNWWSLRAPSWDNPVVYPGGRRDPEILDMEKDMTEEKFKQEIGAEFTEFVGRVFKRFSEEDNVGKYPFDPRWPVFIAEDSGYTNPSVALFVQVDVWDNIWVCGEYYQKYRTPEEFARDVWEDPKLGPMARAARLLYADPADPGTAATLANKWQVQSVGGTGYSVEDRLNIIRKWLTPQPFELEDGHPEKLPKFHIDRESCPNLIREMNDYRYPESKNEASGSPSENPLKVNDHTPEALGRFAIGHFGPQERAAERARVSTATFG